MIFFNLAFNGILIISLTSHRSVMSRVHNIYVVEGECLIAYTCIKHTAQLTTEITDQYP